MTTSPRRSEPRKFQLPEIRDQQVAATWVTRRAISMVFATLMLLATTALVASLVVTVTLTVDGDGVIEPASIWFVRAADVGILSMVLVHTGDTVRAGQVVARLDPFAVSSSVAELMSQVDGARVDVERLVHAVPYDSARLESKLVQAESQVLRARATLHQRMSDFGLFGDADSLALASSTRAHYALDAPSADLMAAKAEVASAHVDLSASRLAAYDIARKQADIRQLEAQLDLARRRLSRQAVVAPAAGIVLSDDIERLVGSSVAAGESILELGDIRGWRARIAVSEHDLHRIRVGDRAKVELPALSELENYRLDGVVVAVGWQPAASGRSDTAGLPNSTAGGYRVLLSLDSTGVAPITPGLLRRGYVAHGKIATRSGRLFGILLDYFRDRLRGPGR